MIDEHYIIFLSKTDYRRALKQSRCILIKKNIIKND